MTTSVKDSFKGIAVFSHIFSNQYIAFQATTSHPLVLSVFPAGTTPGMYIKASQLLSIAADTPHLVDAASFVSFFVTNPGAVKVLGFERGVPASAGALAYLRPDFTPAELTIVNFMNYVASSGVVRPKVILEPPGAAQVASALLMVAGQVATGSLTVSDGAQSFYTQAQKATQSWLDLLSIASARFILFYENMCFTHVLIEQYKFSSEKLSSYMRKISLSEV